jgi:hypothetical protein
MLNKHILPTALAFSAGFLVHMFLFSDVLPATYFPTKPTAVRKADTGAIIPTPEFAKSSVYIEYANGSFTPKTALSKVGNHIVVRNMDRDERMFLDSDTDYIKTPRPYLLSEQIDVVARKSGTFVVKNKLREGAQFTIIIKP